jgi:hypothetical protein
MVSEEIEVFLKYPDEHLPLQGLDSEIMHNLQVMSGDTIPNPRVFEI